MATGTEGGPRRLGGDAGYALAALLVAVSVMAVLLSVALPVWRTMVQREREAELIFRGEQYARAIARYQQAFGNTPPPSLDVLVQQRYLRRLYADPMVPGGAFVPVTPTTLVDATAGRDGEAILGELAARTREAGGGVGGIIGVTSSSTVESLRQYNGATRYNEWMFLASNFTTEAGLPAGQEGAAGPGVPVPPGPGGDAPGGRRGGRPGTPAPGPARGGGAFP